MSSHENVSRRDNKGRERLLRLERKCAGLLQYQTHRANGRLPFGGEGTRER
jgi:hypothetical protein